MNEMSKSERADLGKVVRANARAARSGLEARKSALRADVEKQLATQYEFGDARWSAVTSAAEQAVAEADNAVKSICAELGIPPSFRPRLELDWWSRGENMVEARRAELRRAADRRIESLYREARARVDAEEARLLVELIADGLTSEESRTFLATIPTPEELMPSLRLRELDDPASHDNEDLDGLTL